MLTMPKKAGKEEVKPTSETASFRKVMNGFSPDEVNIYISNLRKKNLELQAEVDKYANSSEANDALRIEQLEQQLREADRRINDANNRAAEAEHKTRELEKGGGEAAEKIKKELEKRIADADKRATEAEKRANEAEAQIKSAESRASESELRAREAEKQVKVLEKGGSEAADKIKKELEKRASEAEKRANEAEKKLADAEKRISEAEKKIKSANERYTKEKELTTMLTTEAGRLAEENEKLTTQLNTMKEEQAKQPAKAAQPEKAAAPAKEAVPEPAAKAPVKKPAGQGDLIEEQKKLLASAEKKIKLLQEQLAQSTKVAAPEDLTAKKKPELELEHLAVQDRFEIEFEDFPLPTEAPEPEPPVSFIEEQLLAPVAASHVDMDYSEFQIPTIHLDDDKPIFEEAPDNFSEGKGAKPAAKAAVKQQTQAAQASKKSKTEEAGERMSRAELKIQIFQEEAEDSYIIPEKYLKMMEDAGHDEDDDFSYLLTDVNPLDDIIMDDEVDEMDSLLVGPAPEVSRPKPDMQRRRFDDNAADTKKNVTMASPRSKSNTP